MRPCLPSRRRSRSEEHTSELQSRFDVVCRLLLEKKKNTVRGVAVLTTLAVRDVVFVSGVRTLFGKAGPKGIYAETRVVFFFNDAATTEIYTLSLHDALPI